MQPLPLGAPESDVTLPATLGASGYAVADDTDPVHIQIEGVTWEPTGEKNTPAAYEEGRTSPCSYYFRPVLTEGYTLAGDAAPPKIEVRYGWGNRAGNKPGDNDGDGYHDGDVEAFKQIVSKQPALKALFSGGVGNPASWGSMGLTLWDFDTGRLSLLSLSRRGLTGTLDVSSLSKLQSLSCGFNPDLTELKLGQHDELTYLVCTVTGIRGKLDVSRYPKLQTLHCDFNDNLTELTLGKQDELTDLICHTTGIRGKLDVSRCPKLERLLCYFNDNLTELTLGQHDELTEIHCYYTGIRGKLDMSRYPKLQSIWFSDNPDLTELTLGQLDELTELICSDNGFSELDVSRCPNLQSVDLIEKFIQLKDGTIRAETGGKVAVRFGKHLDLNGQPVDVPFTLTALPDSGYTFNFWTGLPDSGKSKDNPVSFTPGTGYTYTAYFTPPAVNVPVTGVTLDKTALTLYTNKDPKTDRLTATVEPADATNQAVRWESSDTGIVIVDDSGNVTAVKEGTATITVTTADGGKTATCAVTVESYSSGSGSDNDSEPHHYTITTPQPPKPDNPALAVIELPVTVGDGTATGKPDDRRTASAIAEAGNKAGAKQNGIAVQYDAKTSLTYDGFSITIKRATLERLTADENKVKWLTLNTGIVDLTFDLAALQEIQKQTTGDITLTAKRETSLTGDALAAVGKRPAYRLSVSYTGKDGRAATVQNFGAGRVTVGLAYAPTATEQAGSLCLVYSKDGRDAEWLYSSYERTGGNVIASVGHFSVYAVGRRPAPVFTDTADHWAKADIDFAVSRGLLTGKVNDTEGGRKAPQEGIGETTFSPDSTITRGMFVTALGRLAGVDPAAFPSSSRYTDVADSAIYAPFVEWAASKGIVNGTGEKSFSPDAAITREQMAAIMQRYADKLGYTLPVAREAEIFADEGQITSGIKNAVQAIQQAGIMNGKGGHRFGPKDTATRAEAAAVLRRFAEVVIDRATTGGWGQNDAGKWLYYLDAKPVIGWKQIDSKWYYFDTAGLMQAGGWREINGKWYYFYPDGAMAVNTKIDGYEIGPDGTRKEKDD